MPRSSSRIVTIYLSGGIKDLTDDEAYGWRREVEKYYQSFPVQVITPTRLEYRPDMSVELACRWLVKRDKQSIINSDIVLAHCPKPSWGTAMELIFAQENGVWVITVCLDENPSPWLLAHSDVMVRSFTEAHKEILRVVEEMGMH